MTTTAPAPSVPHAPDAVARRAEYLRLVQVIWPFLATTALILAIAWASFYLMSAARAYVDGESLWSKGQKNAIQYLARYSAQCDPAHFAEYTAAMAVPLGDRIARAALLQPEPDIARATAGFLQGGNHPEDVPGMIILFRHFGSVPLLRRAIGIWGDAEQLLLQIDQIAQRLQADEQGNCGDAASRAAAMDAVYRLNDQLTPMQKAFSDTLGEANRMITSVLMAAMLAASALLSVLGTLLALRVVQRGAAAERALEFSEAQHRLAVDGSNQGLWDLDVSSGELRTSDGLLRLLGHEDGAFDGGAIGLELLLHPDDRIAELARLRLHAATGEAFVHELRLHTRAQGFRHFRLAGRATPSDHGHRPRIVGSLQDVTEQRRLQDALMAELGRRRSAMVTLRATLANHGPEGAAARPEAASAHDDDIDVVTGAVSALVARQRVANDELGAVLSLSPDGFVSFDAAGIVKLVSPAFTRITGLPPNRTVGRPADILLNQLNTLCAPASRLADMEAFRRRLLAGPVNLTLASPAPRDISLELFGGDDAAVRHVLCVRDVTHERALDRLKSEFMSTAAHELRTPMASIFGFIELMLHRELNPERRQDLLGIVHRQALVMTEIIDGLLDLSRLEARGAADLNLRVLDLAELVHDTVAAFSPPPGRSPPAVGLLRPGLTVLGDRNQLFRVLTNLLSNAYKYSPDGGEVRIRSIQAGEGSAYVGASLLGITVEDQGMGMSAADLARAGERFFRADKSGKVPGTGLGLSIVKEVLQLHGGALVLDSLPGRGTSATVWLPGHDE